MSLNVQEVKGFRAADKSYKKYDSRGLLLLVKPNGSKLWYFKYRFGGKEKKLPIGAFPEVSLSQARQLRDRARLAHGDSNAIRGVYNRGNYWDERVKMAQWWSDYLDELRQREPDERDQVLRRQQAGQVLWFHRTSFRFSAKRKGCSNFTELQHVTREYRVTCDHASGGTGSAGSLGWGRFVWASTKFLNSPYRCALEFPIILLTESSFRVSFRPY